LVIYNQAEMEGDEQADTALRNLEVRMNMSKKQIERNKIRVYMIAKEQPIMLNYLP